MKIQTVVQWVDVEVEVSLEDIVCAISEDPNKVETCRDGIVNCHRFLKSVPDTIIAQLTQKQRETIYNALSEQVKRLAPNGPAPHE